MRLLAQNVRYLDGNRGYAEGADIAAVGWTHHDIGANAFLPGLVVVQHAQGQPYNQQNQRDLNPYGNHADDGPDRPVHQVGDDHLVHELIVTTWQRKEFGK